MKKYGLVKNVVLTRILELANLNENKSRNVIFQK